MKKYAVLPTFNIFGYLFVKTMRHLSDSQSSFVSPFTTPFTTSFPTSFPKSFPKWPLRIRMD